MDIQPGNLGVDSEQRMGLVYLRKERTNQPSKKNSADSKVLFKVPRDKEMMGFRWKQFKVQRFSSVASTQKQQDEKREIRVGNILIVQYEAESKAETYRLGLLTDDGPDQDDLVHTTQVTYTPLRELPEANRSRLMLIVPVQMQDGTHHNGNKAPRRTLISKKIVSETCLTVSATEMKKATSVTDIDQNV